jgi:putative endonuclease
MSYYVYLLASRSRTLYTGVTNNLARRISEHREGRIPGFKSQYRIYRLVYFESYRDVRDAIVREKQIKGWLRAKKIALIEAQNPAWDDLAAGWFVNPGKDKQKGEKAGSKLRSE